MTTPASAPRRVRTAGALCLVLVVLAAVAGCERDNPALHERARHAERDAAAAADRLAPPLADGEALTLPRALSLALDHNFDAAEAVRRRTIQAERIRHDAVAMLGSLRATAKDSELDDPPAKSSQSMESGRQSLEPSVSTEPHVTTSNLTYVWSVLDFGLAYLDAQTGKHRLSALGLQVDRIRQDLMLRTTGTYWRVAVLQNAVEAGEALVAEAEARLQARGERTGEDVADVEALRFQKEMAELQLRLNAFRTERAQARADLARLVALPPDSPVRVAAPLAETPAALELPSVEALEEEALLHRPELYADDAEERIAVAEVRKAMLRLLPNVEFVGQRSSSSNDFLRQDHWYTLAIDASLQVLRLPARWHEQKAARERLELARERRLLTAMGILSQLRLALIAHDEASERLRQETRYAGMQARLVASLRRQVEEGDATEDALFRAEAEALFAEIRRFTACGDVYTARARIFNSVGRGPLESFELTPPAASTNDAEPAGEPQADGATDDEAVAALPGS